VTVRKFRRWRNNLVEFRAIGDSPLVTTALGRRAFE
jgi:hypothetical protein